MYYERTLSRRFFLNKGFITIFPLFAIIIFILCAANIAAPPSINLLSEIILIISLIKIDYFIILVFPLGSFLGAVFTLFLFSYSQHGHVYFSNRGVVLRRFREFHLLLLHILPVNYVFLNSSLFLDLNFYLNSLIKILICGIKDEKFISLNNNKDFLYFRFKINIF
jgi:NADH-ubiquinone oxidoreductase chain 4